MAKTEFKSVREYIAAQPKATASALSKLRAIVKRALPRAEEGISYQIPAYRLHGRYTLYFAGYKEHVALYPASAAVLRALGDTAKQYLASKATLRFSLDAPLPAKLIDRAAKARSQEVEDLVAAKKPTAKKPAEKKPAVKKPSRANTARPRKSKARATTNPTPRASAKPRPKRP